ncbi:hypothetical protein K435DRAFT_868247 [Dendrothele bispora CBS 962.96]|uniref:Uncharacterized protein n=1 Tax=Dendrothele bispora (strain CBS 962.96) TaxID=1314807 RepID=A0A4S8LCB9_DENBC|nr:hypothetical protein K435DRAFT_868247 [Dendrothele bispora CBS 962.96]
MPLPQTQPSSPLSDGDVLLVKAWVFAIALAFLLLGIQMILSIVVLYIFMAQGISLPKSKLALSFVTITMFFVSLSSLVMNIEDIIIQIPLLGYNPPNLGDIGPLITELEISINSLNRLNYVLGDIIVVWRAWVLFPQRLTAKIALSICLMGSFGAFVDTGLLVKRVMKDPFDTAGGDTDVILLAVPLILTNLTATTLIGFKAW